MTTIDEGEGQTTRRKPAQKIRADVQRNEQVLLAAAAAVFVTSGVQVPVRDIAAAAGVGMGTIYRHFPTRADLVVAVCRHQVEACAEAGPVLLAKSSSPYAALGQWVNLFVDFLVTKHGLAAVLDPTASGSKRCMPTSLTASYPFALSCSPPLPKPARSAPILMPTN